VRRGVPFDVAFSINDTTAFAWTIVHGENDGGTFNWDALEWMKD
jgi:hypothetical protein